MHLSTTGLLFTLGLIAALPAANLSASIAGTDDVDLDVICTANGHYSTYDPNDCGKYYECNNGQAIHKSCGIGYKFDEASNTCKFHWWLFGNADCHKASPTAAPTSGPNPTNPTDGPTTVTPKNNGGKTDGPTTVTPNHKGDKTDSTTTSKPNNNNGATTKKSNGAAINSFSLTLAIFFLSTIFYLA